MLETASLALVAFLVTIDPVALVPIYLALSAREDPAARRRLALRGCLVGGGVLVGFALVGEPALRVLGISIPAFRIAGGITLLILAVEMVFQHRGERRTSNAEGAAAENQAGDVAVFPLAVPLIAGPAAITTAILQMSQQAGHLAGQAVVMAALLASLAITALVLVASGPLGRLLTPTLVMTFSRLLGLLLAALSVQFVIDGVKTAFGV